MANMQAEELTVDELLERAEAEANAKKAAAAATSRDPRLQARGDAYTKEREEHDVTRSQRRGRDVDLAVRRKSDDSGSANGSTASRKRSRSPVRVKQEHSDSPTSGKPRDSFGDRRDDYYRPRESDDRSYRDRRDDGRDRRERDDGRDRRDRDRDDGRTRRRSPRPRRARTPEPTDDERDRRTVFVQQLAARLRSKELKAFFEQVGPVLDAQIVKDRVSGRSKGVGYVEFKNEESVAKAIQLTGQKLTGIPIIVQHTEAEKNRQAKTTEGTATQSNGIPFHRLYVGNVHFSVTEEDLRQLFQAFGDLDFVQLQKDEATGRSKGYGFVQYMDASHAKQALEALNGFDLANRPIRVGLGSDKFTSETTKSLLHNFGAKEQQAQFQGSQFSGMGGRGSHAGGTTNFDRASGRADADRAGGASALDDSDVAGVSFSNYSRDALMRKLARTDGPDPKIAPVAAPKKPAPMADPAKSRCILIKGAYTQADKAEPNWQQEIETDIGGECNDKYGMVKHCAVAPDSNDGEIYVKFDRVQGGENAFKGLNGRFFGGSMLSAQYVVDAIYNMNFPKAANL